MNKESEEFFEGLQEQAKEIAFREPRKFTKEKVSVHWIDAGVHEGIDATIQALQEMMIGEAGQGSLKHASYPDGAPNTIVLGDLSGGTTLTGVLAGHHGIDGQKVLVFVVGEEDGDGG